MTGTLDLAGIRARVEAVLRVGPARSAETTLALVDEVERLRREVDRVKSVMSFRDRILRYHKAERQKTVNELLAEAAKLRARVAELEGK